MPLISIVYLHTSSTEPFYYIIQHVDFHPLFLSKSGVADTSSFVNLSFNSLNISFIYLFISAFAPFLLGYIMA